MECVIPTLVLGWDEGGGRGDDGSGRFCVRRVCDAGQWQLRQRRLCGSGRSGGALGLRTEGGGFDHAFALFRAKLEVHSVRGSHARAFGPLA